MGQEGRVSGGLRDEFERQVMEVDKSEEEKDALRQAHGRRSGVEGRKVGEGRRGGQEGRGGTPRGGNLP